jgi:hypothetical protein
VAFNFKDFAKFTWVALFRSKGTNFRLTPKRIGWLAAFYVFFPLLELVTWVGFLLDDIFFRAYQWEEIDQPVFIVGNPRSGTTFLHRLLAKDRETLASMKTWEMFLAPSITQRKIVGALAAFDRWLGSPLQELVAAWEKHWQERHVMHKIALRAPEEDDNLLFHIWSNLKIWLTFAILEKAAPYTYFDTAIPKAEKERIMTFYKRCVRRHLHAHGDDHKHYLSKNPCFTPMVDTLYEYFPDAKIIYLVRNPLDMIPSCISLRESEWHILGDPVETYGSRDYVLDMARHWYSYPLERLESAPQDSYIVVRFNDLVGDLERTIADIYQRFGFDINPAFAQVLREEAEKARNYRSRHEYSLEPMGLTREQIVAEYEDVFDRFRFDTGEGEDQTGPQVGEQRGCTTRRVTRRAKSRPRRSLGFARNNWGQGEA